MNLSREEKFQRILDAAIESIAECGYHSCQVAKIARKAGVAGGTIYLYFKNKEEILIRLFQERMGQFTAQVREQLRDCPDTRCKLKTIMQAHLEYMEKNRSLAIVTQLELRQLNLLIRQSITAPLLDYFNLIEEVIREGLARQDLVVTNVSAARQLVFGTLDQATTDWILAPASGSLINQGESLLFLIEGALRLKTADNI
ncbi:MAG TPA: TetR/AcrR family transcriptional regulator [Candidatus Deferrimicrobium sp.]|nr:TetR/AcrR family transcriptional regulator [Candidatus Deferrimicrobium sp.]